MSGLLILLLLGAGIDQQMYEGVHSGWQSLAMDAVMNSFTQLGDWYAIGGTTAAFYFSGRHELRRPAGLAAFSWLGAWTVAAGVRAAVNRQRPDEANVGWLGSSFPSGHTTSYFAVATVYALKFPRLAPALGAAGTMVALSRVYLGRHWPSDVLAGAALGTGVGLLVMRFEQPLSRLLRLEESRVVLLQPSTDGGGLSIAAARF